MSKAPPIQFDIPDQDLSGLSFCDNDVEAVEQWIKTLPMANLGSVSRSLYQALGEINRVKISPQDRFEILEAIRGTVKFVYDGLKKHYLNQPVILPEQPKKVAQLSKALIDRLTEGYRVVLVQCQDKMRGFSLSKPTSLMAAACYRVMSDSRFNLVRSYQLYQPETKDYWLNIHKTAMVARRYKLSKVNIADLVDKDGSLTLQAAYIHINLLGCMRANQLRQKDVTKVSNWIVEWLDKVQLIDVDLDSDKHLIIDPTLDQPAVYQKFYNGEYNEECRSLNTTELILHLKTLADPESNEGESPFNRNLLHHLISAWGTLSDRTFMRLETQDSLSICIGLTATHLFISEGLSFVELIYGNSDANSGEAFQVDASGNRIVDDVWGGAFDSTIRESSMHIELESIDYYGGSNQKGNSSGGAVDIEKYNEYSVQMTNISPGGYCLEWPKDPPSQIRTGEIIGVKEKHHNTWSIGAIRWVKQNPGNSNGIRMGVELLSPAAAPYGGKVLSARGDKTSEYMRVMILPEIKSIGQPMTMITPSISFKEGQKAVIMQNGQESTILLTKQVAVTGSYYQFEFQQSKKTSPQDSTNQGANKDNFDSLWGNL